MTGKAVRSRTVKPTIDTEDDLRKGIRALSRQCQVLRGVYKSTGLPALRRRQAGFEGMARIIVGQQVSVASASAIWTRCENVFASIDAATFAGATDETYRAAGLSRPKIKTFRALSDAVLVGGLDLEDWDDTDDETVRARLIQVSGIGPWTADLYLLACLGRRDAFAAGDLALQVAAQHAYGLEQRPAADDLLAMAEAWRPWRAVAARLLWAYYRHVKDQKSGMPV